MSDVEPVPDPLDADPRVPQFFGAAWPQVRAFRDLLADQGVLRGLIGPREVGRLWERHLLNSAAVVPFLPERGTIVDLGSGAGLPGVVVAAMRPAATVVLLEPMERRTTWLTEVAERLELSNVVVRRARAQEALDLQADALTTRAVAALDKLYGWAMPLVAPGGQLVALKGDRAREEVTAAAKQAKRNDVLRVEVEEVATIDGVAPTWVVVATKQAGARRGGADVR